MADDDVTLFGKLKSKLIDSKQKWAGEGRLLTGKTAPPAERLPPGQRLVENWPVLDLGIQPEIPTHAWRLFVDGSVENPTTWKWGEFTDLPRTALVTDIHCVTAWSRYDNRWEGVRALAQRQQHLEPRHHGHLGLEERPAGGELDGQGLVLGRQAAHRVADAGIGQRQTVGRVGPVGAGGEAELQERRVEQVAGIVAGEGTPGAVGALHAGRQADDQQPGVEPAERSDGCIVPVGILSLQRLPEGDEPRAAWAVERRFVEGRRDRR